MDLQTVVNIDKPDFQIGYDTPVMMLGSCFVENIGAKLEYFKFPVDVNPCGIVYNPLPVADTLDCLLSARRFTKADLLQNAGKWFSLRHHGRFSAIEAEDCLNKINSRLELGGEHLRKTQILVITWGTSWAYRYRRTGQIVANCHKFPATDFERFRLEVGDIVKVYTDLLARLWTLQPNLKIMFTVSPIRHWKDGAHGNQLSKAVLLLAIDQLVQLSDRISYFPSYEIVMDELRDYRFYAGDMLHLSDQGIEYIWEKFRENFMSVDTLYWMKRIDKLNKVLLHRPSDPESEAFRQLLDHTQQKLAELLGSLNSTF